jgi:hypothetical protein
MVRNYDYRKSFDDLVDSSAGPEACWPWRGRRSPGGYGRGSFGTTTYAHRRAYELAVGPVPAGLDVCHACDNPPCCNPAHLWAGTARDNLRDAVAKGRLTAVFRTGERATFHKLTWPAVRDIRARYAAGESQRSLGRAHRVSQVTVHFIVTGKTWPEPTSASQVYVRRAVA